MIYANPHIYIKARRRSGAKVKEKILFIQTLFNDIAIPYFGNTL